MKIVYLMAVFFLNISVYAQVNTCIKCRKCKPKQVARLFLSKYSQTDIQREVIDRNWNEYLGENLEEHIPSITPNVNTISIKFDGLGCVYPMFLDEKKINDKFKDLFSVNDKIGNKKFGKNTFHSISHDNFFRPNRTGEFLNTFPSNFKDSVKEIVGTINVPINQDDPEAFAKSCFTYMKVWNDVFIPEYVQKIQMLIKTKNIQRIVVICHGYNLPYSLAHIQSNNIIDKYSENSNDPKLIEKTLFIKVFWPSLDKKKKWYDEGGLRMKNKLAFSTIGFFSYVTNRAFLLGLNLRKVFNGFLFDNQIDIVCHSSGGTAIAALLVNPLNKIDLENNNTAINRQYKDVFLENKVPERKFRVFLNAASIPGPDTFNQVDMDIKIQKNFNWVVGFNNTDRVLQKKVFIFRFPDSFGNTRLGGNFRNEISKTKASLDNTLINNFQFKETGVQKNLFGHDFFCYLHQELFQKELKNFINN